MALSYRPEIDGLRAIAVMAVVLYHAEFVVGGANPLSGGYVGVDVFFVISGYLITSIILKDMDGRGFSFARFYERRARRILPALILVTVASFPFAWIYLVPHRFMDFADSALSALFFWSNFHFWQATGYFDLAGIEKPLLHTWSLAVEEQFYFLFPPMLLLLRRFAPGRMMVAFSVLFAASLCAAQFASGKFPDAAFYLLPMRGWELLAGAMLARLEQERGRGDLGPALAASMSALGLILVVGSCFLFDADTRHPSVVTLIPVAGTVLLIRFAGGADPVTRMLASRPFVAVGLISYSLYLWHFPVLSFARYRNPETDAAEGLICIALAIALATATYFLVERPARRAPWLGLGRFGAATGAGAALLLALAVGVSAMQGFPGRYDPADLYLVNFSRDHYAAYVRERFDDHRMEAFSDDPETVKVLVIGDSYGQDLVNALHEGGLDEGVETATHYIPAICGNLMLDRDVDAMVPDKNRARCTGHPRYREPGLDALLRQADILWLASNWRDWQLPYLAESVDNIGGATDAAILVLGRKKFQPNDVQSLLAMSREQRRGLTAPMPDGTRQANASIAAALTGREVFIDVQTLLCGDGDSCPVFDDRLQWISYDGGHLTRAGAAHMGRQLARHPLVRRAYSVAR